MSFWGRGKKKENRDKNSGGKSIHISDLVASAIFQEILKDNEIPFVCRQPGAGGYIKILTGGLLTTDEIIVEEDDFERASELYEAYFNAENTEETEAE